MRHEIDNLERLAQLWDKAQANGVFATPPNPETPSVTQNKSDSSYFGLVQSHSTNQVNDCDAKYWKQMWEASRRGLSYADPLALREDANSKPTTSDVAKAMINSPNPIHPSSVGKDQDMQPVQLGVTFSPKDIEELAELKVSLHSMKDRLNELEGRGKTPSDYKTQLSSLEKKMDELSNRITQGFPGVDPRNVKPE